VDFTRKWGILLGGSSDCEELVVVITRDGVNVISGTKEKECNVMDTYIDT